MTVVVVLALVALALAAFLWVRRKKNANKSEKRNSKTMHTYGRKVKSPSDLYKNGTDFIPFEKLSFIKSLVGENRKARTQRAVLTSGNIGNVVHVALKAVASGTAALESGNKARLREELANLWSLSHPNLIQYMGWSVDYKSAEGITYHVVMELKPSSLKQKLKSRPPSPEEVLRMGVQVTQGLDFLHSHNIGHGAIRPSNVLLETDNSVCLCGFGLTKDRVVTPSAFTAPEMLQPSKHATSQSYRRGTATTLDKMRQARAKSQSYRRDTRTTLDEMHKARAKSQLNRRDTATTWDEMRKGRKDTATTLDETRKCRADCYSFAMLLWSLFSWQTPFPDKSREEVIAAAAGKHGTRPPLKDLGQWSKQALKLMQRMWIADPKQRGDMSTACQTLTLCLTREKQGKGLGQLSSTERTKRDAKIMYGLDVPAFAQVLPIAERTFGSSNFKLLYTAARNADVPSRASQLLFACEMLIKLHAEKYPLPSGVIMDTTDFLKKMNTQVCFDFFRVSSDL